MAPSRSTSADAALSRLVAEGVLSAEQAASVSAALAEASPDRGPSRWLAEVAGYVGGALMLGGAAVLLGTSWARLTDVTRSAALAGVTAALVAAAFVVAGGLGGLVRLREGESAARRRVVGVLFALASGTAAFSAGVLLADENAGLAAGAVGLGVAVAGYASLPTAPGLLASGATSMLLAGTFADDVIGGTPLRYAVAFLFAGVVWAVLAVFELARPRALALGIAATIALVGAQQPLAGPDNVWAYGLTAAVAVACFALYRGQRSPVLIVFGVVAVAIAAPEAVWDVTNGTVGGAVILLVTGAALVGASAVGLRLWRDRPREN